MKERLIYLDILRVLATVFVIGVHTVSLAITMVEYGGTAYYVLEIFNFIFLSCNLLFVMISGALLLPVRNERTGDFFRKRFTKVVIPMVVYYILYVCAKEGIEWIYPDHWLPMLRRILTGAPVEAPHFWLVYVIIWLYVLTPLLRFIMANIPDSVLSGLMAVIFLVCALDTYLPAFGVASPLGIVVDSFAGAFLLGYFVNGKCTKRQENFFLAAGVISFSVSCVLIFRTADFANYIYQNAPTMLFFSSAIFIAVKRLFAGKRSAGHFVRLISRYSYSILLIHWGVLHFVVKQVLGVNVLSGGIWGGCILMMALTLVISAAGAALLDNTLMRVLILPFSGNGARREKKA